MAVQALWLLLVGVASIQYLQCTSDAGCDTAGVGLLVGFTLAVEVPLLVLSGVAVIVLVIAGRRL